MRAEVFFRRVRGQRLPEREESSQIPRRGWLTYATLMRGSTPIPTLSLTAEDSTATNSTIAELYEPALVALAHGWISFRGYEAVPADGGPVGYVQEWRCRLA